jgi:hypothetical protein
MTEHISAPVRIFLMVAATLLFAFAAFAGPWGAAPNEPWYRQKLIAGGLFCWALSTFFGG